LEIDNQSLFTIKGNVDYKRFCHAWRRVIACNEMLRATFKWEGIESPIQIIHKEVPLQCAFDSINNKSYYKNKLEEIIEYEWINKPPICEHSFKIRLIQLSTEEYFMIITYHHIIMDGWSFGIILKEFMQNYLDEKGDAEVSEQKTAFGIYLDYCESANKKKTIEFWGNYLEGVKFNNMAFERFQDKKTVRTTEVITIDSETRIKAIMYCRQNHITFATLAYGLWGLMLYELGNRQADICFGVTLSGRHVNIIGIDSMVGLFIDTVPIKISLTDDISVREMFGKISRDISAFLSIDSVSFIDISNKVIPPAHRLYDSTVVIQNYPAASSYGNSKEQLSIHFQEGRFSTESGVVLSIKVFEEFMQVVIDHITTPENYRSKLNCRTFLYYLRTILDLDMKLNATIGDVLTLPR